jgi:hypothetical protein
MRYYCRRFAVGLWNTKEADNLGRFTINNGTELFRDTTRSRDAARRMRYGSAADGPFQDLQVA